MGEARRAHHDATDVGVMGTSPRAFAHPTDSARKNSQAHTAHGFTLIEVLVVVSIVGIMFVGAILLVPGRAREPAAQELRRFDALFELARDQAVLSGDTLGVGFWRQGYAFYRLSDDWQWGELDKGGLKRRDLEEPLKVQLILDGVAIEMPKAEDADPQLRVLASGESTPFELEISDGLSDQRTKRDLLGREMQAGGR